MTSTPSRSGMPGHFGIRITDADKDKLVGELDVDDRHLNNSGHVHGGALAAFADDLGGRLAGLKRSVADRRLHGASLSIDLPDLGSPTNTGPNLYRVRPAALT
jgi:uncharacterized protein (TIGR00369 family)